MLGNVKNAIHRTYHAIGHKHLPRYLAEFCWRFNRRFGLASLLPRLAVIATRTTPMPYRLAKRAEPLQLVIKFQKEPGAENFRIAKNRLAANPSHHAMAGSGTAVSEPAINCPLTLKG